MGDATAQHAARPNMGDATARHAARPNMGDATARHAARPNMGDAVTKGKRPSELYAAAGHHGWLHQQGRTGVGNPRKRTLGLHAAPPTRLRSEASSIGGSRPCSKGRWMEYRRRALSSLLVAAACSSRRIVPHQRDGMVRALGLRNPV